MTNQEHMRRITEDALKVVSKHSGPISLEEITAEIRQDGIVANSTDVRAAVWRLVDRRDVEFANDSKVQALNE